LSESGCDADDRKAVESASNVIEMADLARDAFKINSSQRLQTLITKIEAFPNGSVPHAHIPAQMLSTERSALSAFP
jgi:hypothetical protein